MNPRIFVKSEIQVVRWSMYFGILLFVGVIPVAWKVILTFENRNCELPVNFLTLKKKICG